MRVALFGLSQNHAGGGRLAASRKYLLWVSIIFLGISAAVAMTVVPPARAAVPGHYTAPEWWPLRETHLVGCTNGNGCTVPSDGYHGYWALDINSTRDTRIYAAGAGQVDLAVGDQGGNCEFVVYQSSNRCPDGSRGNFVRINHDATGQVTTYYYHFTSVFVKTGDWVDQNTVLGIAGDSGLAYPGYVHLHFELRHGLCPVDPVPLKACHGDQLKSYPGELGKTSWGQVTAYEFAVRSDGTDCATGTTTTTLRGSTTTTTAAGATTTTLARGTTTTTTVAGPTSGDVTSVIGSASGYSVPNLTVFGGDPGGVPLAPTPRVALAANASNSPQTANVASGAAVFGPARIFSSDEITVSTEASLGAGGSVTSSTAIRNVNASGKEVLTATSLQSTCSASVNGVSGSATVTGGVLRTSEGDPDVDGDETYVTLPTTPAANTEYQGRVETVGDTFRYVFNEQVTNPDGSLTVYAAHLDLLGPTGIGDVYIGGVDCGVTATGTTTTPGGTTTTTPAGGTTTTSVTARGSATTSTVRAAGGPSGTSASRGSTPLARTGSAPQPLVVLSFLMVLGGLALIGLSQPARRTDADARTGRPRSWATRARGRSARSSTRSPAGRGRGASDLR